MNGACQANLLPNYWLSRSRAEIPSLAFNVVALLVSCFLSFRLIKVMTDQDHSIILNSTADVWTLS